jgi:hypothetical protein
MKHDLKTPLRLVDSPCEEADQVLVPEATPAKKPRCELVRKLGAFCDNLDREIELILSL